MSTTHTAPTTDLSASFLRDLRALLDDAFEGAFSEEDWVHSVGGTHVWVSGSDRVVSHGSLVERTLDCGGQSLRVGYVEAVATAAADRLRGHGSTVMQRIGDLILNHHVLGALSTSTHTFYEKLGWERWRGPTFVVGPNGRERTPSDDGDVMILRTPRSPHLDLDGEITCDWRPGDVW